MMAVLWLLTSLLVSVCFRECVCAECFIGNNIGSDGTDCGPAYLATPGDPCSCSSVRLGGVNVLKDGQKLGLPTAVPVKEIVIGEDVTEIRDALGCKEPCQGPLGMSDGFIPDENIHISYTEDIDFGPERARPIPAGVAEDAFPWCAGVEGASDGEIWIQVVLRGTFLISGVQMMTMQNWPAPLTYKIKYSSDIKPKRYYWEYMWNYFSWTTYQTYNWSTDALYFEHPFNITALRLYPERQTGKDVCMQFELLGCQVCQDYLGMENGSIPDSAITASSSVHYDSKPAYGRLNYQNTGESMYMYSGGWCARESDSQPWISVDLGSEYIVTGVITQGSACEDCHQFVKRFEVMYKSISGDWILLNEFNTSTELAQHNIFARPAVLAQYVKIVLKEWSNRPCLRFEVLGCKDCNSTLGMGDRDTIGDEQITASSSKQPMLYPVEEIRLVEPYDYPVYDNVHTYTIQWVVIDLGLPTIVSGITLYCKLCDSEYTLEYAMNVSEWKFLLDEDNQHMILKPDSDAEAVVQFHKAISATFVRLSPHLSSTKYLPQLELWGCRGYCLDIISIGNVTGSEMTASRMVDELWLISSTTKLAWSPDITDSHWVQVDLGSSTVVSGFITQGVIDINEDNGQQLPQWVETMTVSYASKLTYPGRFQKITDGNGNEQIFLANSDASSSVTNLFKIPVLTAVMRIIPVTWHGNIVMKLQLLGCQNYCQQKLGLESGKSLDGLHITASKSLPNHRPWQARLNSVAEPEYGLAGGWMAAGLDGTDWLQVNFARWTSINGIITQGRQDKNQWVTRFKVKYLQASRNGHSVFRQFEKELPIGFEQEFFGNYDRQHQVRNYFPHQVTAWSIRVYPTSWKGAPSMRLELLGCTARCQSQLGLEDGTIPDSAISASESLAENFKPSFVRPSNDDAVNWTHINSTDPWIQVTLEHPTELSGLLLHFSTLMPHMCGLYLKYNKSGAWITIKNSDKSEMFPHQNLENEEVDDKVRFFSFFDRVYSAQIIRLYPVGLIRSEAECYLPRFDFIGCLNDERKFRTCQTLKSDGFQFDGRYELDHDGFDHGDPPFDAYCRFSLGYTWINHDAWPITTMGSTTSYNISYSTSIQQIINVINSSSSCRQYVRAKCGPNDLTPDPPASQPFKWMSRSGVLMSNWGVETGTTGCSCGTSNSCKTQDELCNCAGLRTTSAYDYGDLTDKDTLPVTGITVYSDDISSINVGPLICFWQ